MPGQSHQHGQRNRLRRAVASGTWVCGGAAMASIRVWVRVELAIGLLIVVVVVLAGQWFPDRSGSTRDHGRRPAKH